MTRTKQIVLSSFILIFTLIGCSEIKTNDPKKAYKHWAGTYPSKDLNVLNGQYWESAHLTKEYIMFLKLKPTKEWWEEFLKQNDISVDKGEWTAPSDTPAWFNPAKNTIRYYGGDHFNQSRYFRDTLTGVCFIYEIQL
jgi:hypothetical protein